MGMDFLRSVGIDKVMPMSTSGGDGIDSKEESPDSAAASSGVGDRSCICNSNVLAHGAL